MVPLLGEWCHVAGESRTAKLRGRRRSAKFTKKPALPSLALFSADCNEQFYEAGRNTFTIIPVFVAYVDSSQAVRLNSEHSEFRWVTIAEAQLLVTFGGQRRVYEEIQREFIDRKPTPWHEIDIVPNPGVNTDAACAASPALQVAGYRPAPQDRQSHVWSEAMPDLVDELSQRARELEPEDRARLAEELLASLEVTIEPEVDAVWDEELRKRIAEVESDAVKLVPADEVFARVRRTLR